MPRLQGLIFDLDGTLLDSAPDLRQALNLTLKAHQRRDLTLDEVKDMTGDGMLLMLERAFAATGAHLPDQESYKRFQEFIGHYRTLKPDPQQIYPLARETLEMLQIKGIACGLCTNKQEASTLRLLEDLNLKHFFSFIAGGDTFPVHKPHPDHVRGIMDRLKVLPHQCAMVGDGPNDVHAAHGASIPCLVVTHGYGQGLESLDADALIDGFEELPAALGKLGLELA